MDSHDFLDDWVDLLNDLAGYRHHNEAWIHQSIEAVLLSREGG